MRCRFIVQVLRKQKVITQPATCNKGRSKDETKTSLVAAIYYLNMYLLFTFCFILVFSDIESTSSFVYEDASIE